MKSTIKLKGKKNIKIFKEIRRTLPIFFFFTALWIKILNLHFNPHQRKILTLKAVDIKNYG